MSVFGFLRKNDDWGEFCAWMKDAFAVGDKLSVDWERISGPSCGSIIRINIAKDKPFKLTTAIKDESRLCTRNVAETLAERLLPYLERAIKENVPKTVIWDTRRW